MQPHKKKMFCFSAFTIVTSNKNTDVLFSHRREKKEENAECFCAGCFQPGSAGTSDHSGGTQAFAAYTKWPETNMTDAAEGHQDRIHFSCQKKKKKKHPPSYFIVYQVSKLIS